MSVPFCLPHPVAVSAFMICRGLCACTEMLWMCVLYVSFGSKVRPRTFGCIAMGSALLFIVRSRLLVYSAGSGVNRVQVVLSGFSKRKKRLYQCQSKFFSSFLSKITKYNRVPLGFDPSVARLLGHDPTPRPTCPADLVRGCFVQAKTLCRYGCMYFLAALVLVCV